MDTLTIEEEKIEISNPEKILWPDLSIRKIDYIAKMKELAPYILAYTKDRLLTTIRYPDGINGKFFYQKNAPSYLPKWIETIRWKNTNYILLNSPNTLIWLANQAVLELHTSFNMYQYEDYPNYLVFDLDPAINQSFSDVVEVALIIHETLETLNIKSWVKTSGATGLQIYIPIGKKYNYRIARRINHFFAQYFSTKYPRLITIERLVQKRNNKLYFDYLQMWYGKTITSAYSPRATKNATISTPITWEELKKGIKPEDFTLLNISERLRTKGDIFQPLLAKEAVQSLDTIIKFLDSHQFHRSY